MTSLLALFFSALVGLPPSSEAAFVEMRGQKFAVEVVRSPETWSKGLMFREHLGPREGMLFFGTKAEPRAFWMKNTLVSLDIIFISKDLRVLNIHHRTKPLSLESLPSEGPSLHVLEILGGEAEKIGLKAGDKIRLQGLRNH